MDIPTLNLNERAEFIDRLWTSYGSTDKYGSYTSQSQDHGRLTVKITVSTTGNKPKTYAKARAIKINARISASGGGGVGAFWTEESELPHGYTEQQFRFAARALLDKAYDENLKSMVKAVALADMYERFKASDPVAWSVFRDASLARSLAKGLTHLADINRVGRQLVPTAQAFLDGWCMAKGITIPEPKPDTYPAVCDALLGFSQVIAQVAEFCAKHAAGASSDAAGFDLDAPAPADEPEPVASTGILCMCCLDPSDPSRDLYRVRPSGLCGYCNDLDYQQRQTYAAERQAYREKQAHTNALAATARTCRSCGDPHDETRGQAYQVGESGLCNYCETMAPGSVAVHVKNAAEIRATEAAVAQASAALKVPSVCESCQTRESDDFRSHLDEYGTGRLLCADCAEQEGYFLSNTLRSLPAAQPADESDPFSL